MNIWENSINVVEATYWTYINKELGELKNVFEKPFKGLVLRKDDEDTWEWLEGKTDLLGYEFDISRKHKWGQGLYNSELIVKIKSKKNIDIDKIGNILKDILSTTVYYGNKTYIGDNNYQFIIMKKYE